MTGGRDGLVVVDKPGGWTSHDVVARVRRLAGTRRVGHAGTLDPMATGVLVLGVGAGTKLLHHLTGADKAYRATVRLGMRTTTDDAEGETMGGAAAAGVTENELRMEAARLTGDLLQVPSAVSAIKVDGRRAYARVRAGEQVELAARPVRVLRFDVLSVSRPTPELLDAEVAVECGSGTYVRALARDLGAALGVGGHLTALRRTRVGSFDLAGAVTLDALAERADPVPLSLSQAVRSALPVRVVDDAEARELGFGRSLSPTGVAGTHGVIGPDGRVLALVVDRDGRARPTTVFVAAG